MKKVHVKFPVAMADEIAEFIGVNEFKTILSWMETSGVFSDVKEVHCIFIFPPEASDKVTYKVEKYIVQPKTK